MELGRHLGRSESWVSQVERGVRPIEQISALNTVANALAVPVAALMGNGVDPDGDSLRLELQEALATFRNWVTQLVEAFGVMATGDALLVTYGFSQRLAAILFLASALPLAALLIYLQIMSVAGPLVGLAARIERMLSLEDSLAAIYCTRRLTCRPHPLGSLASMALVMRI